MGYIIKNTSGLVNTRITDTGRQKLSQGRFNVAYFQVGDSEVSYDKLPITYNQANSFVLEPEFNGQNTAGVPQSNKQYVKYPYLVDADETNTYGIPFMDSSVESVYNRAAMRGFFSGNTLTNPVDWKVMVGDYYVVTANYITQMSGLDGSNKLTITQSDCNGQNTRKPSVGDIVTIFYDGNGEKNCECYNLPTPTPTSSPSLTSTPNPTPTPSSTDPCLSPTPTPTPTQTPCLSPTPIPVCPPTPTPDCLTNMYSCYLMLTYRIIDVCEDVLTLDRSLPDYRSFSPDCFARVIVYPPSMTVQYDTYTPRPHWADNVIDFESICDIDQFNVQIWNMNIPWTENPAGLIPTLFEGYTQFGSINYIGSKEYFGYNSSKGQTDTDPPYYYNSFDEKIVVTPEEQKAISILHYTNQTIDFFYGEKFALQPYDNTNQEDTTGQARNFKVHIPWLMWHKNSECCFGQTFWVDPPGFDGKNLFQVQYLRSKINQDMNQPGLRYYNLWDTNANSNGLPSRVGKVFPDSKIIVFDDEEIVAAMSYKSNRNFTLPAPQISLITPNVCDTTTSSQGILTGNTEAMYITYVLENDGGFTNWLHCNYYSYIVGNNNECNPDVSKNVSVRFGSEFPCLRQPGYAPVTTTTTTYSPVTTTTTTTTPTPVCQRYQIINNDTRSVIITFTPCCDETKTSPLILPAMTGTILCSNTDIDPISSAVTITNIGECTGCTTTLAKTTSTPLTTTSTTYPPLTTTTTTHCPICDIESGFWATNFKVLAQKVVAGQRPDPTKWKLIDFTPQIQNSFINGYVTQSSLTGTTFIVSPENYSSAPFYNLNNYIDLVPVGTTGRKLNFGDEYYFYGNIETDIQATIYEMKYKINLSQAEFKKSQNPSWVDGTPSYITEIGLFDENKDLLVLSKLQSPTLRQGIQQYVVKLDL